MNTTVAQKKLEKNSQFKFLENLKGDGGKAIGFFYVGASTQNKELHVGVKVDKITLKNLPEKSPVEISFELRGETTLKSNVISQYVK